MRNDNIQMFKKKPFCLNYQKLWEELIFFLRFWPWLNPPDIIFLNVWIVCILLIAAR